jgi:uncharacterized membrane protein
MRFLLFLLLLATSLSAAPTKAVMFFSPDCVHCHEVIENELTPLLREHPGELEFILINVSTDEGATLFYRVVDQWQIPEDEQGVPTMVIGDQVLIGADEIPRRLPALIATAPPLAPIEGLSADIDSAHRMYHDADSGIMVIERESDLRKVPTPSLLDKVGSDPFGSTLAIALLFAMLISLGLVGSAWMRRGFPVGRCKPYTRLFPFLCFVGLGIALYLGYIELSGDDAICGFVGNCEAVQRSEHSVLFGLFPIGIVGAIGYLALIAVWFWRNAKPAGTPSPADWILPSLVFVSVAYSIYLTFLEPFVIGAICMWCLLSGTIVTALLWLTHPATYATRKKIF